MHQSSGWLQVIAKVDAQLLLWGSNGARPLGLRPEPAPAQLIVAWILQNETTASLC